MDFLNNIDPLIIVLCCGLSCVVGIILFVVLPIIGGVFDIFSGIFEVGIDILTGGPLAWCGCIIALAGCGICGAIIFSLVRLFSTCNTPEAVNFCRLF